MVGGRAKETTHEPQKSTVTMLTQVTTTSRLPSANAGTPRRHALAVESNMPTAAASALHVLDNHSVTLAKVPVTRAVEDCVCYVRKIWTLRGGARLGEKHRKMFAFFGQPFVRATPPQV